MMKHPAAHNSSGRQVSSSALGGVDLVDNPLYEEELAQLAEALRWADVPAFFAIWQNGESSVRLFMDFLIGAELRWRVFRDNTIDWVSRLERTPSPTDTEEVVLLVRCLSAIPKERRAALNAARNRLLDLKRKIVVVEPVAWEGELREAFPDLFSLVREDVRLFQRAGEEDPFETLQRGFRATEKGAEGVPNTVSLLGEILQIGETDAVCWLNVSPDVRVKFQVPLSLLEHLRPQVGKRFVWSPATAGQPVQFRERKADPPDPQLLEEFEKLSRKFRKDVRHKPYRGEKGE